MGTFDIVLLATFWYMLKSVPGLMQFVGYFFGFILAPWPFAHYFPRVSNPETSLLHLPFTRMIFGLSRARRLRRYIRQHELDHVTRRYMLLCFRINLTFLRSARGSAPVRTMVVI